MNAHPSLQPVPSAAIAMSSRDIAELTEKRHDHVLRDIKKMLVDLYGKWDDTFEDLLTDDANLRHLVKSVTCEKDARGYVSAINLDKEHTITLVAGYDVRLRKRIVDRWLELERATTPALSPATLEEITRTFGVVRSTIHKVTMMEREMSALPALVQEVRSLAALVQPSVPGVVIRHGRTAGAILKANGFTGCPRGLAVKVGNWMEAAGCRVDGRMDTGTCRSRLFDPDKAEAWFKAGGAAAVEREMDEKKARGALALHGGNVVSFAAHTIKDGLLLSSLFADACNIVTAMVQRGEVSEAGTPQHEYFMRMAFASAVVMSGIQFPRVTKDMVQKLPQQAIPH